MWHANYYAILSRESGTKIFVNYKQLDNQIWLEIFVQQKNIFILSDWIF